MTTTTRRQQIVWERASPREQAQYLSDLANAASYFPTAKSSAATTNGAGTWLAVYTSNAYLPGTVIKLKAETVGTVIGAPTQCVDMGARTTYVCDNTGALSAPVGTQVDYYYSFDVGMQMQFVVSGKSILVQVNDGSNGKMRYTTVIQLLEIRS